MEGIGIAYASCTGVVAFTIPFGICYRSSILENSDDHAEKLTLDARKREKTRKEQEIKAKHAQIRDDMAAKFPGLNQTVDEE